MPSRTAACHCGRLSLTCEGEPKKVSMCHCLDCQRRTGSAFSVAAFYEREMVHIDHGTTHSVERGACRPHSVFREAVVTAAKRTFAVGPARPIRRIPCRRH
jgi:hypothetical protein